MIRLSMMMSPGKGPCRVCVRVWEDGVQTLTSYDFTLQGAIKHLRAYMSHTRLQRRMSKLNTHDVGACNRAPTEAYLMSRCTL